MPRVYQTVTLLPSLSNSHLAPRYAYLTWLLYRFQVFGSVTSASTETVTMPAAWASARAGLSASALFGLNTRALTFCEINVRRSASWPAASVLRWIKLVSGLTLVGPSAVAAAFAVHTC